MFIYTSIKNPTQANNGHGNAEASIIFMDVTLNGEHIFDVRVFILKYIFSHTFPLSRLSLSDCPSLFPDVLGPGSSWQCHPGFSCLSRCCFWWRRDNNYQGTFFFSHCVSCARPPFSLYCWSRDSICCCCLHHPSHLAVMLRTRVGSVSRERLCLCCTCVGMPRGYMCFHVQVAVYLQGSFYKDYLCRLPSSSCCGVYRASSDWQVV